MTTAKTMVRVFLLSLSMGSLALAAASAGTDSDPGAEFLWFEYEGGEAAEGPLAPGTYRNPILAGFYPDPSVVAIGADYYLVNSSFAYFPGIPIFHSRDLVHWTQLGHVLTRPLQLSLDGRQVSEGIFAPAISHHAGIFYLITTLVGAGGNFYVTASNPVGPWSDPVWLPEIDGIDPSFFFDDDGRAYVVNNGPPPGGKGLYDGHRALWIQEFDVKAGRLVGPREIIVNGGVDLAKRPIWIEGPHIFTKGGFYYLIAAEGGTGEDHSEVVFRSEKPRGPYVPWDKNPILTQRTLDPARPDPVTSTGHADFVETPAGDWWAVFLGCRPYESGRLYNTGRETFLLPVTWSGGWPTIPAGDRAVPLIATAPKLPPDTRPTPPRTGSFTWRDEFDRPDLDPVWNMLRTPRETWHRLSDEPGILRLRARTATLSGRENPTFVGRRQQHARFTATTVLRVPAQPGYSSGIVAFQNETHHFYLGVRRQGGSFELFLEKAAGKVQDGAPQTIARQSLRAPLPETIQLRIEGDGRNHTFSYAMNNAEWRVLKTKEDGSILSTAVAGGFVGTYLGLHARLEP